MERSKLFSISTQVKIGSLKLLFSVPKSWSINKLKCLLTTEIPSLDFDQFQICNKGKLQRGNNKIGELVQNNRNTKLQLQIIKTKSQIKFTEYYKTCMQSFMQVSDYNKQPILNTGYQKYKNLTKQKSTQNVNDNNVDQFNINDIEDDVIQGNNPNNPAHPLLRLLRLLGVYFLLVLIYDHGKAYQIALILAVILTYYIIEFYIKYKQKKLKKNQQNRQNIQQQTNQDTKEIQVQEGGQERTNQNNKTKGLIRFYQYKAAQVIFCFFFTFFPNLTIDIHLDINKKRIQQARRQINRMIPNTFPNPERINANQNN